MGISNRDQQPRYENQRRSSGECSELARKHTDGFTRYVVNVKFVTPKDFHTKVEIGSYNLSYNVFLGYGVVNACLVPVVYFLVIETAGQGLEEIDAWVKDHPGWLVRKVKLSAPWKNGSGTQGGGNISPSEEAQVSTDEVGVPDLIPAEEMDITSTSVGE